MFRYILYLYETVKFNYYYRWFYGSDVSLFDNCSWKAYKRIDKEDK